MRQHFEVTGAEAGSMCSEAAIQLHLEQIDLLRGGEEHNVANDSVWQPILAKIAKDFSDAVIATPPCNTHTRAVWSNRQGPAPLRDVNYPDADCY